MESTEPKNVNSDDIQYGVNSLMLGGLQINKVARFGLFNQDLFAYYTYLLSLKYDMVMLLIDNLYEKSS